MNKQREVAGVAASEFALDGAVRGAFVVLVAVPAVLFDIELDQ